MNFNRRHFLRGAGVCLSLPLLESMKPFTPLLGAPSAATPKRFMAFFVPNGLTPSDIEPQSTGALLNLPDLLVPLKDFTQDFSLISGLSNHDIPNRPDIIPDPHEAGTAYFLTSTIAEKTTIASKAKCGESIDQMIAAQISSMTRLKSLEVIAEKDGNKPTDTGFHPLYRQTISFNSDGTPRIPQSDPSAIFETIFGTSQSTNDSRAMNERVALRKSILDYVLADISSLKTQTSSADQKLLDQYFTQLRAIEKKLAQEIPEQCKSHQKPGSQATNSPSSWSQTIIDLIVLAFQCDLTRVATMLLSASLSDRPFSEISVTGGHHALSHHGGIASKKSQLKEIETWEMQQFGYLLKRLKETPDGNSNMLDNTLLLLGPEMADGNNHSFENFHYVVAGAKGFIKQGEHIKFELNETNVCANLNKTILDVFSLDHQNYPNANALLESIKA